MLVRAEKKTIVGKILNAKFTKPLSTFPVTKEPNKKLDPASVNPITSMNLSLIQSNIIATHVTSSIRNAKINCIKSPLPISGQLIAFLFELNI